MGARTLLAALAVGSTPERTPPAACVSRADVVWQPSVPRAGSLFRIAIAARTVPVGDALVAGERLHFRTVGDSAVAMAAVPIDSANGVMLEWFCEDGSPVRLPVPTTAGSYRLERLRVAPRFGAPPDSATTARMQREAALAAAVSRASHETPRLWSAPFVAPRVTRITSPFGGGRTFNGTVTSRHMGTDYAGAVGAPVRASNRGIVRLVDSFTLGGNVLYIDHGEGLVTAYLHLSKQLVTVGDTVRRGDTIGRVGATGRVTGPHLHFIARYGTITVDPASLLRVR